MEKPTRRRWSPLWFLIVAASYLIAILFTVALAGLGWILFSGGLDMTVVKERRYLLLGSGGLMLVVSAYILLMSIPTSFLSTIRRDGS
ncbi:MULTISPECIES: hypothetical protein [Pseudomonas]|uniref:hypothetical protein n=1 Tax=Pseudomonas TaxID=286 RepID=UPI00055C0D52|nr:MULTISPECIES: hypothetical protein [Pseudomonas]NMZ57191.1 hypothetical protein [Pseudomonas nitroreducens]OBY91998.1 hypothetical protein A6723_015420 [Pseudomonas sp. AU11447]UCL84858.1 hypothetical protein LDJ84_17990 [Pseudomonas sp. HS-18]SNR95253.1 hypothetical protein SAMN05216209_0386 [Pseudomonas nitroreducens]